MFQVEDQRQSDAAFSRVSNRHLDLRVRQVSAADLLPMVAEAGGAHDTLDACAAGKRFDARFQNAPARLILAALGEQLGLEYRRDGGRLLVRCRA